MSSYIHNIENCQMTKDFFAREEIAGAIQEALETFNKMEKSIKDARKKQFIKSLSKADSVVSVLKWYKDTGKALMHAAGIDWSDEAKHLYFFNHSKSQTSKYNTLHKNKTEHPNSVEQFFNTIKRYDEENMTSCSMSIEAYNTFVKNGFILAEQIADDNNRARNNDTGADADADAGSDAGADVIDNDDDGTSNTIANVCSKISGNAVTFRIARADGAQQATILSSESKDTLKLELEALLHLVNSLDIMTESEYSNR